MLDLSKLLASSKRPQCKPDCQCHFLSDTFRFFTFRFDFIFVLFYVERKIQRTIASYPINMNETLYDSYMIRVNANELHVCRFCVRKKRKMKVISVDPVNGTQLADLFNKITQRHLETNADYPDLICNECEVVLRETSKHISAFQEADLFVRIMIF